MEKREKITGKEASDLYIVNEGRQKGGPLFIIIINIIIAALFPLVIMSPYFLRVGVKRI